MNSVSNVAILYGMYCGYVNSRLYPNVLGANIALLVLLKDR